MRTIRTARLLLSLSLLAVGFVLGGTFARANGGDSPEIDVTSYGAVLDVEGTVVVKNGQGFVVFADDAGQVTNVEVRGWDSLVKRGLLTEGSTVHVEGSNVNGKKKEFKGHVTLLK
jgi:hypothetical protein